VVVIHLLSILLVFAGKFKGLSSQCDLSIDDLIDLLHSVDHEKVVNNQAAVISDKALAALLDRTMTNNLDGSGSSGQSQSSSGHYPVNFRVIAESDSRGNLVGGTEGADDGRDTVDCLALKGASTSSTSSTSPEPMATGGSLNSGSTSSIFSYESNAMGPGGTAVEVNSTGGSSTQLSGSVAQ